MAKFVIAIPIAFLALAPVGLLLTELACALSDEVDYSAPYLTVENGELVTKYPAKAHTNGKALADSPTAGKLGTPQKEVRQLPGVLGIVIAGVVVAVAALLVLRRKRQERSGRRR